MIKTINLLAATLLLLSGSAFASVDLEQLNKLNTVFDSPDLIASAYTVSTTFAPNTTIRSSEVNTEFTNISTAVTDNATRISALESSNMTITGNKTFSGNTTLSGTNTLSGATTVSGTFTASNTATFSNASGVTTDNINERTAANGVKIDASTVLVKDGGVTLNNDVTGSPSLNGTLTFNRGSSAATAYRWNETTDQQEFTNDGTNYFVTGSVKHSTQFLTANGTWTRPTGCRWVRLRIKGGGGGGGAAQGTAGEGASPGGGGEGEERYAVLDVTAISSATITIGAGGAGGTVPANTGSSGGNTTWSDGTNTITANGGSGGVGDLGGTGVTAMLGGAGGTGGTGGTYALNGANGGLGVRNGQTQVSGGGAGMGGGIGQRVANAAGTNAQANSGAGGGGGSASDNNTDRAGGNGGSGYISVEELY